MKLRPILVLLPMVCTMVGCVEESSRNPSKVPLAVLPNGTVLDAGGKRTTVEETVTDNPCASQLRDLGGLILQYYALNNRSLPPSLETVLKYADIGQEVSVICPTSKVPYAYYSGGLHLPGKPLMIVASDGEPTHGGKRWCLLMTEEGRPGSGRAIDVQLIPEPIFRTYMRVAPQVPANPAPAQ